MTNSLTKAQAMLFRATILIQISHTVLWIVKLFDEHAYRSWTNAFGGIVYNPDGSVILSQIKYGTPWQLLALLVEIKLLIDLSKQRRWAWCFTSLLVLHSSIYILLSWFNQRALIQVAMVFLIAGLSICYALLWRTRKAFSVVRTDFAVIAVSSTVFLLLVGIERYSLDHGVIDYALPVPPWADFFLLSILNAPPEFSLLIYWGCYSLIATLVWYFTKRTSVGD